MTQIIYQAVEMFYANNTSISCICFPSSLYQYSPDGQYLTNVTVGQNRTSYMYSSEGDLIETNEASGERKTFEYNEYRLFSGSSKFNEDGDKLASVRIEQDWVGNVKMMIEPTNTSLELVYDNTGRLLLTGLSEEVPLRLITPNPNTKMLMRGDEV